MADLEFVEDSDDYELSEDGEIPELMKRATMYVQALRASLSAKVLLRFNAMYGAAPKDPSDFSLWLLSILPVNEIDKYHMLASTDCVTRLRQLNIAVDTLRVKLPVSLRQE